VPATRTLPVSVDDDIGADMPLHLNLARACLDAVALGAPRTWVGDGTRGPRYFAVAAARTLGGRGRGRRAFLKRLWIEELTATTEEKQHEYARALRLSSAESPPPLIHHMHSLAPPNAERYARRHAPRVHLPRLRARPPGSNREASRRVARRALPPSARTARRGPGPGSRVASRCSQSWRKSGCSQARQTLPQICGRVRGRPLKTPPRPSNRARLVSLLSCSSTRRGIFSSV